MSLLRLSTTCHRRIISQPLLPVLTHEYKKVHTVYHFKVLRLLNTACLTYSEPLPKQPSDDWHKHVCHFVTSVQTQLNWLYSADSYMDGWRSLDTWIWIGGILEKWQLTAKLVTAHFCDPMLCHLSLQWSDYWLFIATKWGCIVDYLRAGKYEGILSRMSAHNMPILGCGCWGWTKALLFRWRLAMIMIMMKPRADNDSGL